MATILDIGSRLELFVDAYLIYILEGARLRLNTPREEAPQPVLGYRLAECRQIVGDEIEGVVAWRAGGGVRRLAGRPVRLRFVMADADLYSLRFR